MPAQPPARPSAKASAKALAKAPVKTATNTRKKSPAAGRRSPAPRRGGEKRRAASSFGAGGLWVILLVAFVVVGGGVLLWAGMNTSGRLPLASRPAPSADAGKAQSAQAGAAEADAVIQRALMDMAGLAYEEDLSSSFGESVRQVDFALIQAVMRQGADIAVEEFAVDKAELRQSPEGAYHFQRIWVPVGRDAAPFVSSLREALGSCTAKVVLTQGNAGPGEMARWDIHVNGILTHELHLASQVGAQASSRTTFGKPGDGAGVLRRRAPGSPARLVIVMDDLGQNMPAVRKLLALPYPVTFAIWPQSSHAREAALAAHAAGKEIIVHQPMEPMGYPTVQPGPGTLFTADTERAIEERVQDSLRRVPHAVGLNNHMGSRFTCDPERTAAVLRVLDRRNLLMLDSMTHPGSVFYKQARRRNMPALKRDVFLDVNASRDAILRQLRKAEDMARLTGQAIAIGHPLPETLAALQEWRPAASSRLELVTLRDLLSSR